MDSLLFSISGIKFLPKKVQKVIAEDISSGDEIALQRDFNNEHDPFAVKAFFDDTFIGYVEKDFSKEVSELIDSGNNFNCNVFLCDADYDIEITDSGREKEVISDINLMCEIKMI